MSEKQDGYIPPHEKEPAKKEWWEVQREEEVGFVGDLNGSVKALLKNLLDLGYIRITEKTTKQEVNTDEIEKINELNIGEFNKFLRNISLEWRDGSKKIVLLGDILGDRTGNGDIALDIIDSLEKRGADFSVIAGNHDVGAIRGLMAGSPNQNIIYVKVVDQAPMSEYKEFLDISTGDYEIEKMYRSERFVEHIQKIKKFKVAEVVDDTLFVHSDVNPEKFIALYEKYNPDGTLSFKEVVARWNAAFKAALENGFPETQDQWGNTIIDHTHIQTRKFDFNELCKDGEIASVLCGWPGNRFLQKKRTEPISRATIVDYQVYPNSFFKFLKERGINAMVFGHDHIMKTFTEENVTIIPADGGSERSGGIKDGAYSNGKIKTNGHIDISVGKTLGQTVRSQ